MTRISLTCSLYSCPFDAASLLPLRTALPPLGLAVQPHNQESGDNEVDVSPAQGHSGQHVRRRSNIPNTVEGGDSADDESDSAIPSREEDVVAWKHTDRALNARLSRQEQLEREKGVIEDALRSR